jgi:hypothetical protein
VELLDEAAVRAPVEPELRERFFDFLTTPDASSSEAALDGEAAQEETSELAAMDAGQEEAVVEGRLGPDGADAGADEDQAGAAPELVETEAAEDASGEEVEVTPEELATDLARRMYEVNADLAVAWDAWADIPPEGRAAIVEQARWIAELLPSMEQEPEE